MDKLRLTNERGQIVSKGYLADDGSGRPNMTLAELRELHNSFVYLYDPPVDGATPLDGAGNPRTSAIRRCDEGAKIALGFTRAAVVRASARRGRDAA